MKFKRAKLWPFFIITGLSIIIIPIAPVLPASLPEMLRTRDGAIMVLTPGGVYSVGADEGPSSSRPAHEVYVETFYIDRTEVTNRQYAKYCLATGAANPPLFKKGGIPEGAEDLPTLGITYQEAENYARWTGKQLPTEEQWEVAARGKDGRVYPWGNVPRARIAVLDLKKPAPVATHPEDSSPFGALDMGGNVMEWTSSWYKNYPHSAGRFNETGKRRVIRGGGFCSTVENAKTYARHPYDPLERSDCIGFRCVRVIKGLE